LVPSNFCNFAGHCGDLISGFKGERKTELGKGRDKRGLNNNGRLGKEQKRKGIGIHPA